MAEYDARCVNCLHPSHMDKECPYCPMPNKDNPRPRCKDFVRADLFAAHCMGRIEQHIQIGHGQLITALATIFDLLCEAYPEASDRLKARLEERQKAAEAEMELQKAAALAQADEALKAAKEAEERRAIEALAEGYKNNVVPFPTKPTEEDENA